MTFELSLEEFKNIQRERTEVEEEKLKSLRLLLKIFWRKVYPNLEYDVFLKGYSNIGYFENLGFYAVVDVGSDDISIYTYGTNLNEVFEIILKSVLFEYSMDYENKNRKDLQKDFETRFKGIKYSQGLYVVEYALDMWNKFYEGNIPDSIIEHYEKYLNTHWKLDDMVWFYDKETHHINQKEKDKIMQYCGVPN